MAAILLETVWNAYAGALKKSHASMHAMHQSMMSDGAVKSPVERLEARLATVEVRLAALKDLKPALAGLYAALSDEQKQKADRALTGKGCAM